MSPLILAAISICIVVMACMAYLSKTKERIAQQKGRKIAKYRERARKLDNIIFGLPQNYLPKTLKVMIYASIIDSLRQMYSLSGQPDAEAQLSRVEQTLTHIINIEPTATTDDDGIELKECKYLLKDLYSLIIEFHTEGTINRETAQTQLKIVRETILRVSLDTYKEAANQAITANNLGLALHYYGMANSRLNQNPSLVGLESQRVFFDEKVKALETRLQTEQASPSADDEAQAAVLAQWQALEKPDDSSWKKRRY